MEFSQSSSDLLPVLQDVFHASRAVSFKHGHFNELNNFETNFTGFFTVFISSSNQNQNIENLHPIKFYKLFTKHLNGISNITFIGS